MTDWYNPSDVYGFQGAPQETDEERQLRIARELAAAGPVQPPPQDDIDPAEYARFIADSQSGGADNPLINALKAVPRGFQQGLSGALSAGGQAEQLQMNQPVDVPSQPEIYDVLEKNIVGELPDPQGPGSGVGNTVGQILGNPGTYGPGGIFQAPRMTIGTGIAGHFGGQIAKDLFAPQEDNLFVDESQRVSHTDPLPPFTAPNFLLAGLQAINPSMGAYAADGNVEGPIKQTPKYQFTSGTPVTPLTTAGGPAELKTSELWVLGGTVAASIGMAFAPAIIGRIRNLNPPSLPTFRTVENAAPGTVTISNAGDLARTYDDVNAGALRMARRAGVPEPAMRQLEDTFALQTRANAQAIADSAVIGGNAQTPLFRFQSRVPLSDLNAAETQAGARYAHLRDTFDDINAIDTRQALRPQRNTPPGPTTVRGMTLQDVTREMAAIEAAEPAVRDFSAGIRENNRALRRFESQGEWATLTRQEANVLNAERANTIPFSATDLGNNPEGVINYPGQRTLLGGPVERGSPTHDLSEAMRVRIRERIENEAKGQYIDAMRQVNPGFFTRVTQRELKDNPSWKENSLDVFRRGKKETYTADPYLVDTLKMDPYYMTGMGAAAALYSTKRVMEITTTGALAPWFAVKSFVRNHQIAKVSPPEGMSSPNIVQSFAAIPRQLYPQLARAVSSSLERGTGGWLANLVGQQNIDLLAQRLAHDYDQSLYARMQSFGSHEGSFTQQQVQLTAQQRSAVQDIMHFASEFAGQPIANTFRGFGRLFNAIHNAPSFAFAARNQGRVPDAQLALETRRLTGDPRAGGQYTNRGRSIRFQREDGVTHTLAEGVTRGYGMLTEFGRTAIPWYNPTTQGMKQIGISYMRNPAAFVGRAWLYTMMPAAATYLFSRSLGNDPNGLSYVDHQMNRRSEYMKSMSFYLPVPGRPAEDGIEIPRFHELSIAARLMEAGLDHLFRSNVYTQGEDFHRAAQSFLDIAILPPTPPVFSAYLGTMGIASTGGPFSGEFYKRKTQAFDQNGGLPTWLEMTARALAPGLADIVGASAAAYIQTPEGIGKAFKNAATEGGKRVISKVPIVSDLTGLSMPVAGNTPTTEELFKKQRVLRDMEEYYKTWISQGGQIGLKPRSKAGEAIATSVLGEKPPAEAAGMSQPPPTNPLYNQFMEEVHNKFQKDAPKLPNQLPRGEDTIDPRTGRPLSQTPGAMRSREQKWQAQQEIQQLHGQLDPTYNEGGIGFLSLWNRYGIATKNLQRLRVVNDGNFVTWQEELAGKPTVRTYLEDQGVDPKNLRQVRNFYEKVRQDAARTILFTIRGVEDEFSKKLGQPVKIEDIKPYGQGLQATPAGSATAPGPETPESFPY